MIKAFNYIKNKILWKLMPISRDQLINKLIEKYYFKNYLEIGIDNGSNFIKIVCDNKDSVDPAEGAYNYAKPKYKMTSDDFFKKIGNDKLYDIIFIDGLHESEQVDRDIQNSLKHLKNNGFIILHDCNPIKRVHQIVPRVSKLWNGDVWKSIVKFRNENNEYGCLTIDSDQGLGLISKRIKVDLFKLEDDLDFKNLKNNRESWLGLTSYKKFTEKFLN
ncbi:class I SAM-dependent methyltransferase [Flavobacteriaceae bacterium]|nr:class I SAM-dependent methyltransferase [Flavobacteriaceae bacterium]